jgi:hypothetical protein
MMHLANACRPAVGITAANWQKQTGCDLRKNAIGTSARGSSSGPTGIPLGREHRGFHGDGVRCAGISSGRISTGVWQVRTKSASR